MAKGERSNNAGQERGRKSQVFLLRGRLKYKATRVASIGPRIRTLLCASIAASTQAAISTVGMRILRYPLLRARSDGVKARGKQSTYECGKLSSIRRVAFSDPSAACRTGGRVLIQGRTNQDAAHMTCFGGVRRARRPRCGPGCSDSEREGGIDFGAGRDICRAIRTGDACRTQLPARTSPQSNEGRGALAHCW